MEVDLIALAYIDASQIWSHSRLLLDLMFELWMLVRLWVTLFHKKIKFKLEKVRNHCSTHAAKFSHFRLWSVWADVDVVFKKYLQSDTGPISSTFYLHDMSIILFFKHYHPNGMVLNFIVFQVTHFHKLMPTGIKKQQNWTFY